MQSAHFHRAIKVAVTLACLILAWEVACRVFEIRAIIVPAPSQIWLRLHDKASIYLVHSWITLLETGAGFILAVVVGVCASALIVMSPHLRDIVMPILLIAQLVPKVAIAPILLIWFGYGVLPKVVIAFLVAFFPIVVNTASGLMSVEPELVDLGRSLEATRAQMFWRFRIPSALPELFSGMKIAVTLAIIGAVIGEFVGGNAGLGYLIVVANQELDTALAFAAILLLSLMGILLYALIELVERLALPWHMPADPTKQGVAP